MHGPAHPVRNVGLAVGALWAVKELKQHDSAGGDPRGPERDNPGFAGLRPSGGLFALDNAADALAAEGSTVPVAKPETGNRVELG